VYAHLPWLAELGEAMDGASAAVERAEQKQILEGVQLFLDLMPGMCWVGFETFIFPITKK
jgi:hypothetical protein